MIFLVKGEREWCLGRENVLKGYEEVNIVYMGMFIVGWEILGCLYFGWGIYEKVVDGCFFVWGYSIKEEVWFYFGC